MADYKARNFNTAFSGLITTVVIMAVVGTCCLVGFETLRQMKRLPRKRLVQFWKSKSTNREGKGVIDDIGIGSRRKTTQEDWEMGHLYHARTFHATTPSPPLARWPLAWVWQALRLDDWFYATHCGMDNVVYVRFLRACVGWLLLQTVTTAPILITVHFKFSKGVALTDMSRASLSYLVTIPEPNCEDPASADCPREPNVQGRKLLWIHLCLTWYITATWFLALFWVGKGSLTIRRRLVEKFKTDRQSAIEELQKKQKQEAEQDALDEDRFSRPMRRAQGLPANVDNGEGWRQRTLLVTNLPVTMRDEASIRRYFEEFLRPDDASTEDDSSERNSHSLAGSIVEIQTSYDSGSSDENTTLTQAAHQKMTGAYLAIPPAAGPGTDLLPNRKLSSPIQTVVLVRKMNELSAMLARRQDILQQLEAAHIRLAQNVLEKVRSKCKKRQSGVSALSTSTSPSEPRLALWRRLHGRKHQTLSQDGKDMEDKAADSPLKQQQKINLEDLARRLEPFVSVKRDGSYHMREREIINSAALQTTKGDSPSGTFWEALADVPRVLLDPYQPVTSLSSLFRGQKVPTIDYLLTKLNLLTALVAEMRARPPTDYEPTSTAFVTLRDPRQARMVWRELNSQIVIKVRMAPEVKDLDWDRLMKTSFTGDLVRGFSVNAFFWAFTVFWCIPLQLVTTALFSVKNLKIVAPGLRDLFGTHLQLESFVSVTLPTVIVSLITMAIPELVFQISKRAQGFVTWSALYDQCLCRYWKFIVCNIVIFFCIGVTTVEALLQQIGSNSSRSRILDNIAFSFPTAAPFFVSYLILGMSLHSGFELLGFMVPILQHYLGVNKATTPRARALKTLPRNFNRYYWLPFHILIMTIVFIFAILNPLIIPFALLYIFVAMIVFKKNFAFTYYRRFNEKEGVIYFIRLFRFTLDGLTTGQVVILIFFAVTDQQKSYIALTAVLLPITVAFKILGTKLWKSQVRAIEDDEANAICGIATSSQFIIARGKKDYGDKEAHGDSSDSATPLDARASGRYPSILNRSTTQSPILTAWKKLHDSFHANGADISSCLAVRASRIQSSKHFVSMMVQFFAKKPFQAMCNAGRETRYISHLAKAHLTADGSNKALGEKDDRRPTQEVGRQGATVTSKARLLPLGEKRARSVSRSRRSAISRSGLVRALSTKSRGSDETPFLSGFEAVANHAPVPSEDVILDDIYGNFDPYADGEESMLSVPHDAHIRHVTSQTMRSKSMKISFSARNSSMMARNLSFSETRHIRASPQNTSLDAGSSVPSFSLTRHHTDPLQSDEEPHARKASANELSDDEADEDEDEDALNEDENVRVVRPHAKIRWDDTPNNQARYNNPFYSCDLDTFLWLPRDPLAALDLCDTIEWHGPAFVSSDGGEGKVGEWEEDESDTGDVSEDDDNAANVSRIGEIGGNEEIVIGSALAKRLEEEEDVEQVADPAASVPKNVLNDYRKAIRRASASQLGSEYEVDNGLVVGEGVQRRASNISASSIRSPAPSIRREADRQFFQEQSIQMSRSDSAHGNKLTNQAQPGIINGLQASPSMRSNLSYNLTAAGATAAPSAAGATASPTDTRKTHFAPDPERSRDRPAAIALGHLPASDSMGSVASGTSLRQEQHSPIKPFAHHSSAHSRRATNASVVGSGAASIHSAGTQGPRTVTMRKALLAEVLEEERRRSIRDRLARSASRKKSSKPRHDPDNKKDGSTEDVEAALSGEADDTPGEFGHLRRSSTIMSRHERALSRKRRRVSSSNYGGNGTESEAPISPTTTVGPPDRYGCLFHADSTGERSEHHKPRSLQLQTSEVSLARSAQGTQISSAQTAEVDGNTVEMVELDAGDLAPVVPSSNMEPSSSGPSAEDTSGRSAQ